MIHTMKQKIFLTLFFVPIIILGILLGVWQYHRSEWKHNLLHDYQEKLSQKPALLPTVVIRLKGEGNSVTGKNKDLFTPFELMPIKVKGRFLTDLIFYRPADGGIELITAFETTDGIIAVNAGKMPYPAKELPIETILPKKTITLTGFYRIAEPYGNQLPKNKDLISKIPYEIYFKHYGDKTLSGAIQIDNNTLIGEQLKGRSADYFIKNIPNNHKNYMVTWFLLTAVAVVMYALLLRQMLLKMALGRGVT
jgi:surfeit locus 1 family protein